MSHPVMDWTLFTSALLSATLLPGSSETLLVLRLQAGADPAVSLATATAGNLLGSLLTYAIGLAGNQVLHRRWLRISERELARAERGFARWGLPVLLFAWLPVIGDPLCLLAGLLRVGWLPFVLLVGCGKLARYAAIVLIAT